MLIQVVVAIILTSKASRRVVVLTKHMAITHTFVYRQICLFNLSMFLDQTYCFKANRKSSGRNVITTFILFFKSIRRTWVKMFSLMCDFVCSIRGILLLKSLSTQ